MKRIKRAVKLTISAWLKRHPTLVDRMLEEGMRIRYEMPVPPTHYYSPLPDLPAAKHRLSRWYREGNAEGLDWNLDKQIAFVQGLEVYKSECDDLPSFSEVTAQGYGLGYGEVEAGFLHCMARYFKPRRIIEVGSGVSTYFTLQAVDTNARETNSRATVVCIEPFPSPRLHQLARDGSLTLCALEAQDVDIDLFKELGAGDILFIDSTHVSKVDSDVNWLYLDVLPQLKSGVVIHIHDIPFPYLTFMPEHSLFDLSILWNEAALVKAFLMYNRAFDVLMCQSYLHYKCPAVMKKVVSAYDDRKHFPASLWLMKRT